MFEKGDVLTFSLKEEGVRFNIVGKELTIWNSHFSITPEEIEAFETSDIQLGVSFGYGVMLFLCKLGNRPWNDLAYSYHYAQWLYETGQDLFIEPTLEYLEDDEPLLLKIYLMDTGTTTVVGKRIVEIPKDMRAEIISGLKKQKYEKLPFVHSTSEGAKLEAYEVVKDFIQQQPIEDILNNIKVHIFKA